MTQESLADFKEFALAMGMVAGFALRALKDDELMSEFSSRGVSRRELQELAESVQNVADCFYTTPQPV